MNSSASSTNGATAAPSARLKDRYVSEIRPALVRHFNYSSVMQAPKLEKITVNAGVGDIKQDASAVRGAQNQIAAITGQFPNIRRARKSIAAFKVRAGMPVGVSVTLRGERSYEFLDRLMSIAIPRIRDFRGLNPRSFDGQGNYSLGVREQTIFPEVDYGTGAGVRGLDITITTTARTDPEAFALLAALGMPFATSGRPRELQPLPERDGAEGDGAAEGEGAEGADNAESPRSEADAQGAQRGGAA